jgi:glucose/arabinose dehydrogenase
MSRVLLALTVIFFCAISVCTNPHVASHLASQAAQDPIPSTVTIQLQQVATGLSSPVFVCNAHDGTNRLFIVEQPGVIKVLQPGSSTPTVFLDITSTVLSGGEQGLLGLAFHPQYSTNRRFFVDYTRQTDGATVIAEYHASAANPNVADPTENVLLTIAQPFANHNGGMVVFGPDNFLYIGMGDGGSGNDPGNRAQNINELLGKILRIDVDHPNGTVPYSSPSSNPFFGAIPGRDEIYAVGMRNPWRFSFDKTSGALYVGDVGQNAWEEVDIVTNGGNYGWRVFEGMHCTNLDPSLCSATGFTGPILEYGHTAGRCSITGGYVYRGPLSTLPNGSYVYADFCTGEIFMFSGGAQSLLLDTTLNISSFGEDESGELYVVALGGQVYRITSGTNPPCTFSILPTEQSFSLGGGTSSITVSATAGCAWTAVSNNTWITVLSGASGTGNGSVSFAVTSNKKGTGPRTGTITVAGQTFTVNQDGPAGSCTFNLNPSMQSFDASGGDGGFQVVTGSTCSWTAMSNAAWITVTSGSAGTGSASVAYHVDSNPSAAMRQGTINVHGQLFTVNQAAGGTCSFSLNSSSASFGSGGGVGSVNVMTGAGCMWSAVSNAAFITITSGSSGSGNGTVNYSVMANSSTSPRSGTMTIAGQTFTVNQDAATPPSCTYSILPTAASFPAGGGSGSTSVTAPAGCPWSATSNAPWITINSGGSGSGSGMVNFSVGGNPATATRIGSITVAGLTFTVSQAAASSGCSFSISPTSKSFGTKGGTGSITVTADAGCAYTVLSNASWITVTSGAKGNGSGTVSYSVSSNGGGPRTGTITVAGLTFTVTQ